MAIRAASSSWCRAESCESWSPSSKRQLAAGCASGSSGSGLCSLKRSTPSVRRSKDPTRKARSVGHGDFPRRVSASLALRAPCCPLRGLRGHSGLSGSGLRMLHKSIAEFVLAEKDFDPFNVIGCTEQEMDGAESLQDGSGLELRMLLKIVVQDVETSSMISINLSNVQPEKRGKVEQSARKLRSRTFRSSGHDGQSHRRLQNSRVPASLSNPCRRIRIRLNPHLFSRTFKNAAVAIFVLALHLLSLSLSITSGTILSRVFCRL
mmetsp:Transcript_42965/g.114930  ORF Transcript_42965/g.114930 Transcript_42965/m.114930 type:complete len:264 (-) Transcript_42965:157-948(-)